MDLPAMFRQNSQGIVPVLGLDKGIALLGEGRAHEVAYYNVVLHNQYGFVAGAYPRRRKTWGSTHIPLDGWKVNLESRPPARLAIDPDTSAALLDDAVHGRKPKARPFSLFFGSEERLEDTAEGLCVHADSGVA